MSVYHVKIGDRTYEVEIEDLHARPVIAVVDGAEIEVWPEEAAIKQKKDRLSEKPPTSKPTPKAAPDIHKSLGSEASSGTQTVKAPIPGVVLNVSVTPGDEVKPGQELCIIEAMKMKNTIRSNRSGTIERVRVSPGQTVQHNDVLMEFA